MQEDKKKMNEKRIAELQKQMGDSDTEDEESTKLFNPRELMRKTGEIRSVSHPKFGLVRFGVLTFGDLQDIAKYGTDKGEASISMLWKMLQKADMKLTREEVKRFPMADGPALLALLMKGEADFLLTAGANSEDGSKQTGKHKKSDSSPTTTGTSLGTSAT